MIQEANTGYEEVMNITPLDMTELWVGSIMKYNPNKHDRQGLLIGKQKWII